MKSIRWVLGAAGLLFSAWAWAAVNVNAASAGELAEGLNGVGDAIAERIVAEREANGAFKDAADLEARVKGIGPTLIEKNASDMTF